VSEEPTTAVIQRYLDALPGDAAAEPVVRELLARAPGGGAASLAAVCAGEGLAERPTLAERARPEIPPRARGTAGRMSDAAGSTTVVRVVGDARCS
jgi:hypothetical protein